MDKRNAPLISVAYCYAMFLALFTVVAVADPPAEEREAITIRVGFYENRPKIYLSEAGDFTGFFPEILEAIAAMEGWRLEYVPGSWQDGLDRLGRGEIDLMPDVALSPERQQLYEFNEETVLISWAAVYVRPQIDVQSFHDLAGKRIGLLKGGIYSEGPSSIREVLNNFSISAEYLDYDSYEDVFKAMSEGEVDAGVVNNIFGAYLARDYHVTQTPMLFSPAQLRFAFPRRQPRPDTLISRLDERLRELKQDSQSAYYRALDEHLFGMPRSAAVMRDNIHDILSPAEQEWIGRHPKIRMGIDPEFYPFIFRDEKGVISGIGSDYVNLLNARLGINMVDAEPHDWVEVMAAFRRGEIDVLPCVGVTLERTEFALFTKPFIEYQRVILTKIDTPFISDIDDIVEMRVGVQARSSHEGYIRDNTRIEPILYGSLQETLSALSAGKIDAVVGNLASATYWIRRLHLTNLKVAAPVSDESYQLHFAVRKDWPELVTILNKGLDLVTPEEKQSIRNQWIAIDFRPGIAPHVAWRIGLRIAAVVFLIVAAILFWTYRLKREVKRRKRIENLLQFRVGFERLASEVSSRFIGASPDEIDKCIQLSLTELACFTGATAGFVYLFNENGIPERAYIGGDLALMKSIHIHPEYDRPEAPWLTRIKEGKPLVAFAAHPPHPAPPALLYPSPPWLTSGSLLEVPLFSGDHVRGFFGLIDLDGNTPLSRQEDVNLLFLVGQMFNEAMRRNRNELALRQYTEDLAAANRRLQELDRLKSLFIASVSHELRTPLNSIIGFTGVILKGMSGELNPRQKDQMQRVNQSAQHLLSLITDIIDISKIEAGHVDIHPEEFNLQEVIQHAIEAVRPHSDAKGLGIFLEPMDEMMVFTDRKRVRQCIFNYLSNAVKYTEKGSVKIEVRDWGEEAEVLVHDTGIGISPEDQKILFSPFVRLDSHLRVAAGGTGLGLYLTRKIVMEILQGAITVASQSGKGSTFGMKFPKRMDNHTRHEQDELKHEARLDH
ncbi:MAG TPA: transporter substrate-binding domain-containing protein [Kiritimatiellia bacterium]|nr:transporter substrate-binding domain-containing protein [Kiritimatiellia bacterium]